MEQQNFQNHVKLVKGFHFMLLPLILLSMIGAGVNLYHSWGIHDRFYSAALLFVLMWIVLMAATFGRLFALKAQDRAIRANEDLRHFAMTGKLLDPRLTVPQIVGLRFASDAEFVELARKAAESGMAQKEIKQAVKDWRADHYRV